MPQPCALVWFRNDLRVSDNPALAAACDSGLPLLCLYVHDESSEDSPARRNQPVAARPRLEALEREISRRGGQLHILSGAAENLFPMVAQKSGATKIFWNRRYGGAEIALDTHLKQAFREQGRDVASFNGALLAEPWQIQSRAGAAFKVFTPFWRALREQIEPSPPLPAPERLVLRRVACRRPTAARPRRTRPCAAKVRIGPETFRTPTRARRERKDD